MSGNGGSRVRHLRPLTGLHALRPPDATRAAGNGAASRRSAAAEITETIVRLLCVHAGQGPAETKTVLASDLAVVTLSGCLTPLESTLADEGRRTLVSEVRTAIHRTIRGEATAAVESITGRRVVAYLTDQQHEPDFAIVAFVFAGRADEATGDGRRQPGA